MKIKSKFKSIQHFIFQLFIDREYNTGPKMTRVGSRSYRKLLRSLLLTKVQLATYTHLLPIYRLATASNRIYSLIVRIARGVQVSDTTARPFIESHCEQPKQQL